MNDPECENAALSSLTRRNVEAIAEMEAVSEQMRTRGERLSDVIARQIGSWPFLVGQVVLLGVWMLLNTIVWITHWDTYPYVLLNLALSFQAAFAGPIIMMSQNRQSRLAERRNQLDLQINLLAEQENTEMLRLLRLLYAKSGVPPEELTATDALSQQTRPGALADQIAEFAKKQFGKVKN